MTAPHANTDVKSLTGLFCTQMKLHENKDNDNVNANAIEEKIGTHPPTKLHEDNVKRTTRLLKLYEVNSRVLEWLKNNSS
jgi:hypothetical protein